MIRYVLLLLILAGCLGCNPRVMKCGSCGDAHGVIGGNLPLQGTKCDCGGRCRVTRRLTMEEWRQAKKRGYVTEQDGRPVE